MILRERIVPQSEVIRAIVLSEDSGGPRHLRQDVLHPLLKLPAELCPLFPSRVGQHVAIGMATKHSGATRLRDSSRVAQHVAILESLRNAVLTTREGRRTATSEPMSSDQIRQPLSVAISPPAIIYARPEAVIGPVDAHLHPLHQKCEVIPAIFFGG